MGTRVRLMIYGVDLSGSMDERDVDGEIKREKVYKALMGLGEWIRSTATAKIVDKLERTYIAVGYFGELGFSESKSYLFDIAGLGEVARMMDVRQALNQGAAFIDEDSFKSIGHDGTDVGQLVQAVKSAVERFEKIIQGGEGEGIADIRYYLIIMGDGCYNKYKGSTLSVDNVYDKMIEAANELNALLSRPPGASARIKLFLLWGDPSGFEEDSHICPWRASLMASRIEDLHEYLRNELEKLESEGVITRGDDFFRDPNKKLPIVKDNPLISDFAVARLVDIAKLAEALTRLTTAAATGH
ncbi:MAG: hypothetical protein GSR85_01235 [Desulfurococcales archaeon]|nr:hypothetical protein [Desulfurococcales archaeon]